MSNEQHSYNSGRIRRTGGSATAQTEPAKRKQEAVPLPERVTAAPKPKKKKRHTLAVLGIALLSLVAVAVALGSRFFNLIDNTLLDPKGTGVIDSKNHTSRKFKGDVINILVVGVDHEENRDHELTDLILYISFDLKNNKLYGLQIPRDSYVGDKYPGSNGRINALMSTGPNTKNPINNLVDCLVDDFALPVDRYVAIDMDGFHNLVNALDNIYVYVPRDMEYAGSRLTQGYHWLDGNAAEFFVRNRHGEGFERSDIDRLDNQRYFYAAIFNRFMQLTPSMVVDLIPVFAQYCSTDFSSRDLADIATAALSLKPEDVTFIKVPGVTPDAADTNFPYNGNEFYYIDLFGRDTGDPATTAQGLTEILNQYFRTYDERGSVPAEQLGSPKITIPDYVPLYPTNIQTMGDVQATIPEDTTGGVGEA